MTPDLPSWYPAWARELAELYFSGTTCLFVLHGNVHDLLHCSAGDLDSYCNLPELLEKEMQELAAVLECTQLNFLPADWRARVVEPGGRARLQERFMEIRQLLGV